MLQSREPAPRKPRGPRENPDGRWRVYNYDELIKRDKASLDIFWLKDESLENPTTCLSPTSSPRKSSKTWKPRSNNSGK